MNNVLRSNFAGLIDRWSRTSHRGEKNRERKKERETRKEIRKGWGRWRGQQQRSFHWSATKLKNHCIATFTVLKDGVLWLLVWWWWLKEIVYMNLRRKKLSWVQTMTTPSTRSWNVEERRRRHRENGDWTCRLPTSVRVCVLCKCVYIISLLLFLLELLPTSDLSRLFLSSAQAQHTTSTRTTWRTSESILALARCTCPGQSCRFAQFPAPVDRRDSDRRVVNRCWAVPCWSSTPDSTDYVVCPGIYCRCCWAVRTRSLVSVYHH